MTKDFNFHKLDSKDKRRYIIHQILLLLSIVTIILMAINNTNPVIETTSDRIELTLGGILSVFIIALAVTNRLKKIFDIKFLLFLIVWILLIATASIIDTLIWGIGAAIIPLAIDDIIMSAYWNKLWYNKYE